MQTENIGINLSHIDSTVNPKNDIYKFANGKWLASQQIPSSDGSWGSFNEIKERNTANLNILITDITKDTKAPIGTSKQKIRDFYLTAMDSIKADQEGISPISTDVKLIQAIATKADLIKTAATLSKKGVINMVGFHIETDLKNSLANSAYLNQSGIGLPDRDYYFESKYASIKKEYQTHIIHMLEFLGTSNENAISQAQTIINIESALAKASMNATEERDIEKQYNLFTKAELVKTVPNINWDNYFNTLGIITPEKIIIMQPNYYKALNSIIDSVSISDWKNYLSFHLIEKAAPYLSSNIVTEHFKFNGTVLAGRKTMKPRYKRVQGSLDMALGEALGKFYVDNYFDAKSKQKVNEMVDNLIASYRDRINSRDWMSAGTKIQAQKKLDKLIRKLGFPDKWINYVALVIGKESYWKNMSNAMRFHYNRMLAKINKPVDKMEWGMTPPTVNAYYNPSSNEIAFPAGIMQMPFFSPEADNAFNYGVMGAIIGHELTHGFDDQGALFDADGNLKNWWTDTDFKKFKERTKLIIDQFNDFVAIDSLHVNGELTQGENIADLGGLTMAYYAYKKSLKGIKSPVMAGYTGEQRFFISWAQGWKILMREAALKQLVATNPHSPGNFRAIAPLSNMTEFYEAFGIKEGDGMFRPANKRVNIW